MSDTSQPTRRPMFVEPRQWRVHHLAAAKAANRPITMLTAYDALTAAIIAEAGIDTILVGDSLGNVALGYDSTIPVTIDDMERATAAVCRAVSRPFVIADLPFGSYEADPVTAFSSAARLIKAGAHAVKLEGGTPRCDTVQLLTSSGIPVVGHLGFTPQSEHILGGPRVQGRGDDAADQLIADAHALETAGACMLVLELVPAPLAQRITEELTIPTIGIGAGPHTSGQVLVWSDMAGMSEWTPTFVQKFGDVGLELSRSVQRYCEAVRGGTFPQPHHYKTS